MKINRRMNLVIPVERDRGGMTYVHSIPISREVFEQNFLVIARTHAALWGLGLAEPTTGPRIAALMLRKTAKDLGLEKETDSLVIEIRRLSNVIVPTDAGWETLPMQDALQRKLFDEDELSEVENAIIFFTVTSWMHKRSDLTAFLGEAVQLWGARLESLSCTEYANSLRTSMTGDSTGAKKIAAVS